MREDTLKGEGKIRWDFYASGNDDGLTLLMFLIRWRWVAVSEADRSECSIGIPSSAWKLYFLIVRSEICQHNLKLTGLIDRTVVFLSCNGVDLLILAEKFISVPIICNFE